MLSVCIEYSMRDVICDVIYCAWAVKLLFVAK